MSRLDLRRVNHGPSGASEMFPINNHVLEIRLDRIVRNKSNRIQLLIFLRCRHTSYSKVQGNFENLVE